MLFATKAWKHIKGFDEAFENCWHAPLYYLSSKYIINEPLLPLSDSLSKKARSKPGFYLHS